MTDNAPTTDPVLRAPHTGQELRTALQSVHGKSVRFWNAFNTPAFLAPIGAAWSPAENVRHLTKTMRAVTLGLALPRLLLLFDVFHTMRASRSYNEVRTAYLARLSSGATAGPFTPAARPVPSDPEAERAQIMSYHAIAMEALCARLARWPEPALDRRSMPHPVLGALTVREMMLFVLYHNQHHVDTVRKRLAAAT